MRYQSVRANYFGLSKLLVTLLVFVGSSYSLAANYCSKVQSEGQTQTLENILLSSTPGEVCSKFAAGYAPYVISSSMESTFMNPYGGAGYCRVELSPPYEATSSEIPYYCGCASPYIEKGVAYYPDCSTKRIGFFNGVSNTPENARQSLKRLERELGNTYKKRPLEYELFYNQNQSVLEDIAETFAQRNKELGGVLGDRWEIYWEILAGRQNQLDSLTGGLLKGLANQFGNSANALLQLLDSISANILNQLIGSFAKLLTLMSTPPTAADTAAHVAKIVKFIKQGGETSGMVLVAHSQGNLFVNAAYKRYLNCPELGCGQSNKIKVVHIAPASPTLTGSLYLLADIDIVINGLRIAGINSVPSANISLPYSAKDTTGHGFEPTYMDTARVAYAEVLNIINYQLGLLKSYIR